MFRLLLVAVAMLAAGVLAVRYLDQAGRVPVANAMAAAAPAVPNNSRSLEIKAGNGGHFQVEARVDGRRLAFVVDTGASQITIRASDAARLGFHPSPRDYTLKINTANGEGRAARVELRMLEVGDIIVRDIVAIVVPDEALSVNLLGMSFLSRVRWTHERGRLVLEQ
ncbi:MAG: aspartyl protease family protein [Alphaproteobacteria bacterium]|jgi:aspartyl protease family protein|nr:aspartyl protease family protein [Alphaproteobacteria bacterium]